MHQLALKIKQYLHVAKIIKVRFINKLNTPNNILNIGIIIHKARFAGFDLIKYSATLFKVKEIISPIQQPSINIPSLGK